jgi:hypothetical protein
MAYKRLNITDFAKAGLNSDIMPWDLPGNFLTNLNNVRINNKKLSPFGGSSVVATMPIDFAPGMLMPVGTVGGTYWILAGLDEVLVYDGSIFSDISLASGYPGISDADVWSGCLLARIPVITNPGSFPQYWPDQNPAVLLEELPWSPGVTWDEANQNCQIMRSHKQYLFAMNLFDGANQYPDAVGWSVPADIGGIPETWDYLDTTNTAGRTWLAGSGGDIVDGHSMRDAFCVYRQSGISVFDYVGGPFVWQIRHLSSTIGLIAPDSIAEVKGTHFLIGDGDIVVNDGNKVVSLLHNRIKKRFTSNYNSDTYKNSYVVKNNSFSEVWFCVPDANATYPTIAYIYNWRDDTWAIRDIPEGPDSSYGSVSTPDIDWANVVGQWQNTPLTWARKQATPLDDTVVQCTLPSAPGEAGELLLLDHSGDNILTPYDMVIERVSYALEGLDQVTTITRIYPHIKGPGIVYIEAGSQDHPGSAVRWKPGVYFDPVNDRKVDIRTTGDLHCFRFTMKDVNSTMDLSGMDIEYVVAGVR